MFPSTVDRVPAQTADEVNRQISEQTRRSVAFYAHAGKAALDQRLRELDEEWDIERVLETNAAIACLTGVVLGATVDRRFFYFPAVVGGFLLQHALQGWCPPVPVFRRLGVRTSYEIDEERYALKALRGDFQDIATTGPSAGRHVDNALAAIHR
jgi:hypothetical protein